MDLGSVAALVALLAGAAYAYFKKGRVYVAPILAGAALVLADALKELKALV